MARKVDRREFVLSGAAAVAAAAVAPAAARSPGADAQAPTMIVKKAAKPVVIASENGNRFKHDGTVTGVEKAFTQIVAGGDVLDAVIAAVNVNELDPTDESVGYGGLPNADGVVQLDASVMHGPKRRAGAVAALEGVRTPSLVAKAVMENTDHHLLVGAGAQAFARHLGFTIEDDLSTPKSRAAWLEWKRRTDGAHYLDPIRRSAARREAGLQMAREGLIDGRHYWGTINCNALGPTGAICGVTTTSGMAFKIPGRAGDSPILGAGLYVDGDVGAAGSTGRGEANLYHLCSFLIVEEMRRGTPPKDAGLVALKRIKANTVEKRLLTKKGNPNFQMIFYMLNAKGEYASVCMYPAQYGVCTEAGPQTLESEALIPTPLEDEM